MSHTNTSLCVLQDTHIETLNATVSLDIIDYRLYSIPEYISAISYIMILVGAIEFLCAQIPYLMEGLIVRIIYSSLVPSLVLNRAILYMFMLKSSIIWKAESKFGSEFWYLQIKLIFLLIMIISSCTLILEHRHAVTIVNKFSCL